MDDNNQTNKNENIAETEDTTQSDKLAQAKTLDEAPQSSLASPDKKESSKKPPKLKPSSGSKKLVGRLVTLVIVIVIGGASGFCGAYLYNNKSSDQTVAQQKVVVSKNDTLVASIAKKVGPSVVSITTKQLAQANIFGGASVAEGAGTGIVLTKDGLVLTNKHVVPDGISSVSVVLSDGAKHSAQVLARDPISDIAFVKINGVHNLQPASLGDSSQMQVGDSVVAIGNALGQFQNTVTTGIISGIGRPITAQGEDGGGSENLQNLFQTDAAINPGNSGGPLVNMNGQVIGMNTAVAGDAQNIGFAMPLNDIKSSINSVEKSGKVVRPYLGVRYVLLTPDVAKQLGLSVKTGAYITGGNSQAAVLKGSPADKAGLKANDVITKVNDQTVDSNHSLQSLISNNNVGGTLTLTVLRGGKTISVKVTLQAAPSNIGS